MIRRRGTWRAWLSESAHLTLAKAAERAHPRETGGVLVGVTAGGRPWVTHAIEVPSKKSASTFYELPAGARSRVVESLREADGRLGYLGEWHSHPSDVAPSSTDVSTIAALEATGDCTRPVLFVLRRRHDGDYQIDARQWSRGSLRPLRLIEAGPLPEAPLGRSSYKTAGSPNGRKSGPA